MLPKKRLDPRLFEKIKSHPKIKLGPGAIRNAISEIRKENPGITLNAAAYEFARRRGGFSLWKSLGEEDRLSLQYLKSKPAIEEKKELKRRPPRLKVKQIKPSFESTFIESAKINAEIYPYIYILENELRMLILEKFSGDKDWWYNKKFVKEEIQNYAKHIQEAEKKYVWLPKRADHPIYYVGLSELLKIIEKNWGRFKNVFKDLGNLRTWINEVVPIRNLVAHNIKTQIEERRNVEIRTKYILTLITKSRTTTE